MGSAFLKAIICLLPWPLKRYLLTKVYKYEIHRTARIGLSWIFPSALVMDEGAAIGHFNVAVHLDQLSMAEHASISRGNWITGFSTAGNSRHFSHQPQRRSVLSIGKHTAIVKNHHIDCTSQITIGDFTTIAGYQSQFLTHSIDVVNNRQDSHPIHIGDYCFVGTNCVLLGGASLPSRSVLGAKSLLNKKFESEWKLYGGVPAKPVQDVPQDAKYFHRPTGFVY